MAKIELNSLSSGYNINAINVNFGKIETEFKDKVVYRNETSPMGRDLDLNGFGAINLRNPVSNGDAVSYGFLLNSDAFSFTGLEYKGFWQPGVAYSKNNYVTSDGFVYIAQEPHTSAVSFIIDLSAGKWVVFSSGGGDMVSTNNLSDVASSSIARSNLNVPSRTGDGATGSWNINAATATLATLATDATNADNSDSVGGIAEAQLVKQTEATGSAILPTGTTAQRDVVPAQGYLRYNSTSSLIEVYNGVSWEVVGNDVSAIVPAGAVMSFARNTAPTGWLKANGAAVSRTTYATLFAAIGTTFGAGDGSTTFTLPDLRGEFIRGWDDSRGIDSSRVFGSAQASQMSAHTHNVPTAISDAIGGNGSPLSASNNADFAGKPSGSAGGTSNSSETRPRNVALLACIKF